MRDSDYRYCPRCRAELVRQERGGQLRPACPSCSFVQWGNPVPIVAAIVERAGRVILVRSIGWPESWYGLVAGFLETGEKPEDGALREVREELGIEARLGALIGVYPFERFNQIIFVYHVNLGDGPIRLATDELVGHREVPIERLKPWTEGTGPAVRDWLASRGYRPESVPFGTPIVG